jgi:hypothetical protein
LFKNFYPADGEFLCFLFFEGHPDLSIVIGQSLFYLQKLSEYKLIIQKEYKLKIVMPRIKIIVGRNSGFIEEQKACLRMLNTNLNAIQIITYDDLVTFGKLLLTSQRGSPCLKLAWVPM